MENATKTDNLLKRLSKLEKQLEKKADDEVALERIHRKIGNIYYQLWQLSWGKDEAYRTQALEHYQAAIERAEHNPMGHAFILSQLMHMQRWQARQTGDNTYIDGALRLGWEVIDLAEQNPPEGDFPSVYVRTLIQLLDIHSSYSDAPDNVLPNIVDKLSIGVTQLDTNDRRGLHYYVNGCHNLGRYYERKFYSTRLPTDWRTAKNYYIQILPYRSQYPIEALSVLSSITTNTAFFTFESRGFAHYREVITYGTMADEHIRTMDMVNHPLAGGDTVQRMQGTMLQLIAQSYVMLREWDKAQEYWQRHIDLLKKQGHPFWYIWGVRLNRIQFQLPFPLKQIVRFIAKLLMHAGGKR